MTSWRRSLNLLTTPDIWSQTASNQYLHHPGVHIWSSNIGHGFTVKRVPVLRLFRRQPTVIMVRSDAVVVLQYVIINLLPGLVLTCIVNSTIFDRYGDADVFLDSQETTCTEPVKPSVGCCAAVSRRNPAEPDYMVTGGYRSAGRRNGICRFRTEHKGGTGTYGVHT